MADLEQRVAAGAALWASLDRLWVAAIAERRARAESVGPTAEEWAGQR